MTLTPRGRRIVSVLLAVAFLVWSGFIAFGAGFLGALLNCSEDSDGCNAAGFPSLVEPWTWGDYDVFPEVFFVALLGLCAAALLVTFVLRGSRAIAAVALVASLALLSYPFFAGLTESGEASLAWGVLLGLGAVATTTPRSAVPSTS